VDVTDPRIVVCLCWQLLFEAHLLETLNHPHVVKPYGIHHDLTSGKASPGWASDGHPAPIADSGATFTSWQLSC
jgi:hypothetical protein